MTKLSANRSLQSKSSFMEGGIRKKIFFLRQSNK